MTARDTEAVLLARCAAAARQGQSTALNQCEANVFRLAALVVQSRFPSESRLLMQASDRYFAAHPNERLPAAAVVQSGWIFSLPRLREMLSHELRRH